MAKSEEKVTLYNIKTGEPKEFFRVDAKEQLALSAGKAEYTAKNPKEKNKKDKA